MTHIDNKFKNVNGVFLTKDLFFETATNKENILYTLKTEDHKGYPSLYKAYMETNDPTEYRFATEYLDGWEHWKTLSVSPFFAPYIAKWREELEIRYRSAALASIMEKAAGQTRESFQAAKYLTEGFNKKTRGRPSNSEIEQNAKDILMDRKRQEEDFLRLVN